MRMTVVGCTGSMPGPDSPASCYLVEAGERVATGGGSRPWRVLLDLGNGALGPLQRYTSLLDLDAVLVTHTHADHCLDLCSLYVGRYYDPRLGPPGSVEELLPVHGPAGTRQRIEAAYGDPGHLDLGRVYDVHSWQARVAVTIGPFTVTPFPANHTVEAFGLRVVAEGRVLAYTGDTDTCPAVLELAADADLLLAEAAFVEGRDDAMRGIHLTGRRAGELARDAGARSLMLTHLPPWNDPDVAVAEARQVYPGPVSLAAPALQLQV
jgi:ribonuclease BN (tRNA processing enzyme)